MKMTDCLFLLRRKLAGLAVSVLVVLSGPVVGAVSIAAVDFSGGSSDLTECFTQVLTNNNSTSSSPFAWNPTVGTGETGGITVSGADITAIYHCTTLDTASLLNARVVMSVDFKTPSSISNPFLNAVAMLGFTGARDTGFGNVAGNVFLGARVRHNNKGNTTFLQVQTRRANGGLVSAPADSAPGTITLAASTWYRLELSRTGAPGTFGYTAKIYSLGTDGADAPAIISDATITGAIANPDLAKDTPAFASFRGVGGQSIVAMDNISVSLQTDAGSTRMSEHGR